uniref:Uncharacterized protein n=1 Tax=Anopheles merus TaxID=30066 RepID=A0A182UXW2_ANOME
MHVVMHNKCTSVSSVCAILITSSRDLPSYLASVSGDTWASLDWRWEAAAAAAAAAICSPFSPPMMMRWSAVPPDPCCFDPWCFLCPPAIIAPPAVDDRFSSESARWPPPRCSFTKCFSFLVKLSFSGLPSAGAGDCRPTLACEPARGSAFGTAAAGAATLPRFALPSSSGEVGAVTERPFAGSTPPCCCGCSCSCSGWSASSRRADSMTRELSQLRRFSESVLPMSRCLPYSFCSHSSTFSPAGVSPATLSSRSRIDQSVVLALGVVNGAAAAVVAIVAAGALARRFSDPFELLCDRLSSTNSSSSSLMTPGSASPNVCFDCRPPDDGCSEAVEGVALPAPPTPARLE